MKHIKSNGRTLEVREATPVLYRLTATGREPLPLIDREYSDAEARLLIKSLAEKIECKGESP